MKSFVQQELWSAFWELGGQCGFIYLRPYCLYNSCFCIRNGEFVLPIWHGGCQRRVQLA